jgi:hypothetical protein
MKNRMSKKQILLFRQSFIIKSDNIQILKKKDKLNAICIYNIMIDKRSLHGR